MNQMLDLHLTLKTPPDDAPSETIASLEVRCDALGLSPVSGVLTDPLKDGEREQLRWYLEEYWKWPFEQFKERAKGIERLLGEIGQRFYQQLSFNTNADRILQAWSTAETNQRQISLFSEVPAAFTLPWELLHDEQGFLVLRNRPPVSIIRKLPQHQLSRITPYNPPLRILMVTARPAGAGFIDPRADARALLDGMQEQIDKGLIEVEFLRPPTLPALRKRLENQKRPIHLLHFDGHGVFAPGQKPLAGPSGDERLKGAPGQGLLAFEDDEGKLSLVSAEQLGQVLQDSGVALALLNACQSAISDEADAFSSVGGRLIGSGLDAVLAMSASVLVASATRYVSAFYAHLAEGAPVPLAHERARQALHDDPRRHLQIRQADREPHPVELADWWVPHFYQQRALTLQPTGRRRKRKQTIVLSGLPDTPRYGFSGRARELLQIERWLWQQKLVVIAGFGGVGKTALAREAADWLTRTGMYTHACFVSFEHGGDASTLLSELSRLLGVYDGHYNPHDHQAALAKLAPALKKHPTLIIADNLESLLPGGEAPLREREQRLALWDTLLALSKLRAGVLLTSRDLTLGDGKLAEGEKVAHLPLGGLHREDAYLFASKLLNDLQIDRARAPYRALRDLLEQLDQHPLAIQLVLPALRTRPLDLIRVQFAQLLDQFTDDKETGRNRSLLASLQYSLDRLSAEQRALLPRLALFEGGAKEDALLSITEIPESAWASLRATLEQAALLTPEQVGNFTAPFLHFHPVLAPFLRSQPGADDPELRARYTDRYYWLVSYLYIEDTGSPQSVRALVWRELPNLHHVLALLMEQGQRDATTELADKIIRFLTIFGRLREREEVRQRVARAFPTPEETLTQAELIHQHGLGEDELARNNVQAALARFTALLARIEALPVGAPLGPGSYAHCQTLGDLARCLDAGGQPAAAEARLRKSLTIITALLNQEPENRHFIVQRGLLLTDLGSVLSAQGRYTQAREVYEQGLQMKQQQEDVRGQAVILEHLGTLALEERHYDEARARYTEARALFNALGEPAAVAVGWHQLGRVAQEQQDWDEAGRCYRESLVLHEQHGDLAGAAISCNGLGNVAQFAGRPAEAEGWYKRALELAEQTPPGSLNYAQFLNNLAALLVQEMRAGRASLKRLAEVRNYAEQTLAIKEPLDASAAIWTTLRILAEIAEMGGQTEAARAYRRRERETYAAFPGNRYYIDRQHGRLIHDVVAATRGNAQLRARLEAALPMFEANGWHIADAIQHIWAGERDWHALAEGLNNQDALLILRVLETLAQPAAEDEAKPDDPVEQLGAAAAAAARGHAEARAAIERALPQLEAKGWHIAVPIRRIWAGERDLPALVAGLDTQDTLIIERILDLLTQPPAEEEAAEDDEARQQRALLEGFASAVAAAAGGDQEARSAVEEALPQLEANGWRISSPIQCIWAGERDEAVLVAGLDAQETQLIQRILARLAAQPSTAEARKKAGE